MFCLSAVEINMQLDQTHVIPDGFFFFSGCKRKRPWYGPWQYFPEAKIILVLTDMLFFLIRGY